MNKIILLIFAVCLMFDVNAGYSPNLSPSENIESLIYRLAIRYGMELPENMFKRPLNFEGVDSFLCKALLKDSSGLLSATERSNIEKAMLRISPRTGILKWTDNDKTNLVANLKLLGDIRPKYQSNASADLKGIINTSFSGNLDKLSFYAGVKIWTEFNSDTMYHKSSYQPYDGIPYNLYGRNTDSSDIRSSDMLTGGIRYDANRIRLETAIDYLRLGPALYCPVTLSGTTAPITYLKGIIDLKILEYTHIVGMLRNEKDKPKYIYVQRFDSNIWKKRLTLGFNEIIINGSTYTNSKNDSTNSIAPAFYQERGLEWVYMIPFVPFKFVEHYAGDRDNAAISFDANLNFPASFRWYMEFFIDDMLAPWKLFSNDWGNKWATTLGFQYFGKFRGRDLTFSSEYSHVEPWVYTHVYGGSHDYSNFGQCLGAPLGPNSQCITASLQIQTDKLNTFGVQFVSTAKNDSVRGGKITDVFQNGIDKTTKRFLGPGTVWYAKPGVSWCFNPFGRFSINALYEIDLMEKSGRSSLALWGGLNF